MATACADDAATGAVAEPEVEVDVTGIELRRSVGPRAVDADEAISMIVDSIDVSGGDIFLAIRVVDGTDELLDLGIEEALFGSPQSIRDDLGNTYPRDVPSGS